MQYTPLLTENLHEYTVGDTVGLILLNSTLSMTWWNETDLKATLFRAR